MKTQAALLVILLLTGISAAYLPTSAEPTLTPHEDPATTKSTIDAYSFLAEYATIFSLMSNQFYGNASQLSEKLSHITVPADLTYIINRYNNLTQQLINVLNDLQGTLDSASSLLDQNRLTEAEQALDHASVLIAKAQILLGDLKDATATVSQRLGVFSSTSKSSTQQAYSQLQSMLEKLSQLIERYHELLDRANQRVEEIKTENLYATTLTLNLNSTSCYIGSTISVAGTLTAQSEPLDKRIVKIIIDGTQTAESTTDANGNYQTAIEIPYKYVYSITIQTIFSPTGNDKNAYFAALSPTITLKLLYYITNLEVSAPDAGYPGLPFAIMGKVTDAEGHKLTNRQVTLALDGTKQTQLNTNQEGTFTAKFTINTQTTLGKHSLTVSVDAQNFYAPTSKQKTITIQKIASDLQVNAPTFIVLPAKLEITGKASSTNPLKEAIITAEYANISSTTKTRDDGSFNLTIEVPLNTALAGSQELKVQVQPSEPWQAAAETTKNIFALNSVSTSVALASSGSIFALTYMKLTKTKKNEKAVVETKQATATWPSTDNKNSSPLTTLPIIDITRIRGPRGQIIQFYAQALTAVQGSTGTQLISSMTLREYAQAVQLKIGAFGKEFRALTGLAEKSLYSPHEPELAEIEQARKLSEAIRRDLNANT
jgi:hypothetical protein